MPAEVMRIFCLIALSNSFYSLKHGRLIVTVVNGNSGLFRISEVSKARPYPMIRRVAVQ